MRRDTWDVLPDISVSATIPTRTRLVNTSCETAGVGGSGRGDIGSPH